MASWLGEGMPDVIVQGACSPLGFLIIRASMHPNLRKVEQLSSLGKSWNLRILHGTHRKEGTGPNPLEVYLEFSVKKCCC